MIKLLKIELKKILYYKVFWILTGLYFLFLGLGILMAEFILNNWVDNFNKHLPIPLPHSTLYFFPDIWQNMMFFASIRYILIFPAIIIIILITNEFTFRTIRQNLVNGMSKQEFLVSKLQVIFLVSVIITIILTLVILLLGILHTEHPGFSLIFSKIAFVPGFFIQLMTFLLFAFFFGFIFRNTGLTIALFTLYALIIEPVLYYVLKIPYFQPNNISPRLPVNSVLKIVEYPNISFLHKMMGLHLQDGVSLLDCSIPLFYSLIMVGIVFWVMLKRDV
jgi:ABC-2 type transport system permease protein